jgi:ubiquinone/menaquinone biosynthesis C-methylase UbiE
MTSPKTNRHCERSEAISTNNSLFQSPLLYDSQYHTLTKDIRFYTKLAQQAGGPVLELGVGTGRIALAILKAGIPLTGIDISTKMLKVAEENLKSFSSILSLKNANFSDFELKEKFNLIFGGFNSLHHLKILQDFEKLLTQVRKHLSPKGTFAFDLINPQSHLLEDQTKPILRERFYDENTSSTCEVWETSQYNSNTQSKTYAWKYRWENGREENQTLTHRFFFPNEIQQLIQNSKFQILQHMGDLDGCGFSVVSPKQIFVLRSGK